MLLSELSKDNLNPDELVFDVHVQTTNGWSGTTYHLSRLKDSHIWVSWISSGQVSATVEFGQLEITGIDISNDIETYFERTVSVYQRQHPDDDTVQQLCEKLLEQEDQLTQTLSNQWSGRAEGMVSEALYEDWASGFDGEHVWVSYAADAFYYEPADTLREVFANQLSNSEYSVGREILASILEKAVHSRRDRRVNPKFEYAVTVQLDTEF